MTLTLIKKKKKNYKNYKNLLTNFLSNIYIDIKIQK